MTEAMSNLLTSIKTLEQAGDLVDLQLRTDSPDIHAVETELGVHFTDEFTEFHSTMSYLRIGGDEFIRLEQLGDVTVRLRSAKPGIRKNWIPLVDDGMGGLLFRRLSDGKQARDNRTSWRSCLLVTVRPRRRRG